LEWAERKEEIRTKKMQLEIQIESGILSFATYCENVSTALVECMKMEMPLKELGRSGDAEILKGWIIKMKEEPTGADIPLSHININSGGV
jgi:hypothetical protein